MVSIGIAPFFSSVFLLPTQKALDPFCASERKEKDKIGPKLEAGKKHTFQGSKVVHSVLMHTKAVKDYNGSP